MTEKLKVLVRLDLNCAEVEVSALGHVTAQSVQVLYLVLKRANHLKEGLHLVVDVSRALVEPAAMERLQETTECHRLPASVDPLESECNLSVLPPAAREADKRPRPRPRARARERALSLAA